MFPQLPITLSSPKHKRRVCIRWRYESPREHDGKTCFAGKNSKSQGWLLTQLFFGFLFKVRCHFCIKHLQFGRRFFHLYQSYSLFPNQLFAVENNTQKTILIHSVKVSSIKIKVLMKIHVYQETLLFYAKTRRNFCPHKFRRLLAAILAIWRNFAVVEVFMQRENMPKYPWRWFKETSSSGFWHYEYERKAIFFKT